MRGPAGPLAAPGACGSGSRREGFGARGRRGRGWDGAAAWGLRGPPGPARARRRQLGFEMMGWGGGVGAHCRAGIRFEDSEPWRENHVAAFASPGITVWLPNMCGIEALKRGLFGPLKRVYRFSVEIQGHEVGSLAH